MIKNTDTLFFESNVNIQGLWGSVVETKPALQFYFPELADIMDQIFKIKTQINRIQQKDLASGLILNVNLTLLLLLASEELPLHQFEVLHNIFNTFTSLPDIAKEFDTV